MMEPQRKYLKDYQAPCFQVDHFELHFDLGENKTRVRSSMALVRKAPGSLELDGVNLQLVSVSLVNSKGQKKELSSNDYRLENERLIISDLPERATLEIVTDIKPQENTSLEGLYKSGSIFCTQCEAQGFRKITYFLDRPDVMTSYTVTIEADEEKYPVLLSNGDRVSVKALGQGRHQAVWRDPHKKPSYLFALVAGDLGVIRDQFRTQSGREVQLEIFATHGKQQRCHHAMESLKKSMKWDEVRFGREYDLANFMIVAIDDFNGGAMENKGLNIFNSRLIMADPKIATDADYSAIESVVAHEYFHNWTGNRVTLRDWFQLSLKEGLTVFRDQEFSADMGNRGLQRIQDVDQLRDRQFVEDGGPNAHPVRPESCLSVDNFYTATIYDKGAELIRMMQILTGRRGFRKGMDLYFEKHDGQAVTTEDFGQAISEPNQLDLSQFKLWYSQFGTPTVEVLDKFFPEREEYHLTLKQSLPTSDRQPKWQAFHIPVLFGLLTPEGNEIPMTTKDADINSDGESVLHLREKEQTFIFKGLKTKPIPSLFREFSAPVNVQWDASLEERLVLMKKDRDGFNRRETAQKIYLEVFQLFMEAPAKGSDRTESLVPLILLDAIREIVRDTKMDAGFKAAMLTWPVDSMLVQSMEVVDVQALKGARESFQKQVAEFCEGDLKELYHGLHRAPYLVEMSTEAYGVRSLKNRALEILQSLKKSSIERLIEDQYYKSENMTDRLAALFRLVDGADSQTRQAALEHFRAEFEKDGLVLNKWFGVQAAATHSEVFSEVQKLVIHPLFQVSNPNHVYSLIRSFGNNFVVFNDPKNDCYKFYLKFIETLDAKNPQVAARLCGAFNLYKKLKPDQQKNLIQQVKAILDQPSLSKNTRELLEKII